MPRFVVSLRRVGPAACCRARPSVRTTPVLGTVVHYPHRRACRVGRLLTAPAQPRHEIAEITDRRTVKR